MSLEMFGVPWQYNGVDMPFPTPEMNTIRSRGTIPVLDWGSDALGMGLNQPQFTLASISNGSHDAYITKFAQAAAAWKNPFFLRFDAEMNGWWLPWSEQTNGNQPGDFVRAWRHTVDIFRAQGATNVTWVWCPNIVGPNSTSMNELYPGDNYVDWVSTDGYNYGTDRNNQPQSFNQIFGFSAYDGGFNTYQMLQTLAPTKPIMIAEVGSSETGGSKAAWLTDAFGTQLASNFPAVKAVMYFNWNDGDTALTWPIESSVCGYQCIRVGNRLALLRHQPVRDAERHRTNPAAGQHCGPADGDTRPADSDASAADSDASAADSDVSAADSYASHANGHASAADGRRQRRQPACPPPPR